MRLKFSLLLFCFVCLSSQLNAQCQINLEIMELFCTTDTTYTLVVDINASNLPGDSVEVNINNELLGVFDTIAFPLTLNDIVHSGGVNDEITICSVDDNSCCGLLTYEVPTSYCADCFNYDLYFEFECDTDSTYEFVISPYVLFPDKMAPQGNMNLEIDNNFYDFEYEYGNSYTFSGVQLIANTVWHDIIVYYADLDPVCGIQYLLVMSPDCEQLCTIDTINLKDFTCTSDTTYNMVVDPIWMTPDELSFLPVEISVNGESLGTYSQDSTLYNVFNIPTSDDGISILEICVPEIPFDACCFTMEYNEPNCGTTSVSQLYEAQEIKIYPNPTHDIIYLENVEGELKIFNSSGKLILHEKQIDQQIDVGLLTVGVYYLEIVGENIRHGKFIKH